MNNLDENQIKALMMSYNIINEDIFKIFYRKDELVKQIFNGIHTMVNVEELIKQEYVLVELQWIARGMDKRINELITIYK